MSIVHHRAAWTAGRESVSLHPVTAVEAARLEKAKAAGRIYAAVCCTECLDGKVFATRAEAERWEDWHICKGRPSSQPRRRGAAQLREPVPPKPRQHCWTAAEDAVILANPHLSSMQIGIKLGLPSHVVHHRRTRLCKRASEGAK